MAKDTEIILTVQQVHEWEKEAEDLALKRN
jgi:hypothetical protein